MTFEYFQKYIKWNWVSMSSSECTLICRRTTRPLCQPDLVRRSSERPVLWFRALLRELDSSTFVESGFLHSQLSLPFLTFSWYPPSLLFMLFPEIPVQSLSNCSSLCVFMFYPKFLTHFWIPFRIHEVPRLYRNDSLVFVAILLTVCRIHEFRFFILSVSLLLWALEFHTSRSRE